LRRHRRDRSMEDCAYSENNCSALEERCLGDGAKILCCGCAKAGRRLEIEYTYHSSARW
jgi:hypothetical protein